MDTRAAAERIGTDAKSLRKFIRTPESTFAAVGSGGRYDFDEKDIPELSRRFKAWQSGQSPKPAKSGRKSTPRNTTRTRMTQDERDRLVWEEEGDVVLPDIRDRSVLDEVRAEGARRAAVLDEMLIRAGLHISQHRHDAVR